MTILAIANAVSWTATSQQFVDVFITKWYPGFPQNINWLAIIFTLLLSGFFIWTIWDLSRKIDSQEEKKPRVRTEIFKDDREYFIKVINEGNTADFKTEIHLEKHRGKLKQNYLGCWKNHPKEKVSKIWRDDYDLIPICKIITKDTKINFELYCYDVNNNQKNSFELDQWIPMLTIKDDDEIDKPLSIPLYWLLVSILTEPSSNRGTFKELYTIDFLSALKKAHG